MTGSGTLTLFLQADPVGLLQEGIGLSAFGAAHSGVAASVGLYAYSDGSGNVKSGTLPLAVLGDPSEAKTRYLNLFTFGEYFSKRADLTLFAANTGQSGSLTLFTSGSGVTADATPLLGSLSLHIRADPAEGLPLFCRGPGDPIEAAATLFTQGANVASSGLPLWASGLGVCTFSSTLYCGGF